MNHSLSPSITLSDQSVYSGTSEGPRSNKALIAAIDPYLKKYKSGPESTLSLKQVSELPEYRILKDNFIVAKNRLCYVKRELSKKRASEVKKSPVQSELFTPNNFSPLPLRDFHSPQYEVDRILSSPVPQVIYRPIQSITPPATRNQLPSTPSWENTVLWSSPVSHAIYQPVKSITAPPRKQVTSTPDWENTLSKRLLEVRIEDMSPLEVSNELAIFHFQVNQISYLKLFFSIYVWVALNFVALILKGIMAIFIAFSLMHILGMLMVPEV